MSINIQTQNGLAKLTGKSDITIVDIDIPASWNESENQYIITVPVTGVTEDSMIMITTNPNIKYDQYAAIAKSCITGYKQSENSITLRALGEKPTIVLPIRLLITNI